MRTKLLGAALIAVALAGCGSKPAATAKPHHNAHKTTATTPPMASAFAVTIDNASGAWPQAGIASADLVFEIPAEGNITRYLAVYWHQSAPKIGPVRSTRIYFDNITAAYGWPLAHAGGNVDALKAIGPLGIKNLDQIWTPGAAPYFWRGVNRQPPHNLYTSASLIEKGIAHFGYATAKIPDFASGTLKGPSSTSVKIVYADYPGVWVYEPSWLWQAGNYVRYVNGQPDVTQLGHTVTAQNVVIIYAQEFPDPDPYTPGSINFNLTSGSGWLLSHGVRQGIEWSFKSPGGFSFTLASGQPAPFAKGQTWVELVPVGETVSFGS